MKTRLIGFILAASFAALLGLLPAQPAAHYEPGVEGIKAATLPPPGVYFRDYNYVTPPQHYLNRVAAVGPEINVAFPKQMLFASFRYDDKFVAESRVQGNTFTLTLTKRF